MRKILSALFILCSAELFAENCQLPTASDALTMYSGFEKDAAAELSVGKNKPAMLRGKTVYLPGIQRKYALLSGKDGATVFYECKKNLDFDRPGTLMIRFKANENWHQNPPPYIVLWAIGGGEGGYLGLRISRYPVNSCPCQRNLEFWIYHKNSAYKPMTLTLKPPVATPLCQNWHMMAMAWSGDQVFLSFDGMPFRAYKLDRPLRNDDYKHFTQFALGHPISSFLIDDFRIYRKKLSESELNQIWNETAKD